MNCDLPMMSAKTKRLLGTSTSNVRSCDSSACSVQAAHFSSVLKSAIDAMSSSDFALSPDYHWRQIQRARFSPSLSYGRHFCPPMPDARQAAVMILIQPHAGGWAIPLTVRPNHLPDHPGQVCLPGGRLEPNETTSQAAEREFCEELGLEQFPTSTIGALQSIYVYNSNFYLTPCVSVIDHEPHYTANPSEVESIVYLPLNHLFELQNHVVRGHSRGPVRWTALGIESQGIHVWGATAIVLAELAAIL